MALYQHLRLRRRLPFLSVMRRISAEEPACYLSLANSLPVSICSIVFPKCFAYVRRGTEFKITYNIVILPWLPRKTVSTASIF